MVCRYFGLEDGGIAYLLRNPTARVLKGNPDFSRLLAESIPSGSGQRYTSGVLSEPGDITEQVRAKSRTELEKQMRAELPNQSLEFLWVRHYQDEDHFFVPNLELVTLKKFSPYVDRIDRYRFRSWIERFNLQHGLHDPNSTVRVEPDYTRSRLSKSDQELLMDIWALVDAQVKAGTVSNRSDMLRYLKESGFELRDKTHAGSPLQQIGVLRPDGRVIRLKGSYYFRADFDAAQLTAPTMELDPKVVQKRIQELDRAIRAGLEFKAYHTIGHIFGKAAQQGVVDGQAGTALRQFIAIAAKPLLRDKPAHSMFSESGIHSAVLLMKTLGEIPDPILSNPSPVSPERTDKPVQNAPISDARHQEKLAENPQQDTATNGPEIDFSAPSSMPAYRRKKPMEEPEKIKPQPKPNPKTPQINSKLSQAKKGKNPQRSRPDDGSIGGQ